MRAVVEISMYPLDEGFVGPIQNFIDRLNGYPELRVETNALSTHVWGDYDRVLEVLTREMKSVHAGGEQTTVFVLKVLSPGAGPPVTDD